MRRVAAAALQHLRGLHGSSSGVLMLEHGTHFALKVQGGWWLGRANQVLRPAGTRGFKVAVNEPMSLEDAQAKGVVVTGSYFRKEAGGLFTHAPKGDETCTDGAQYKAESVLALVQLSYMETTDIGDHVYKFENSDLVEELNSAARAGEKATASAADKEKREEKSQKRMLDNTGDDERGAGRGAAEQKKHATTRPGTSRAGRPTARGVA